MGDKNERKSLHLFTIAKNEPNFNCPKCSYFSDRKYNYVRHLEKKIILKNFYLIKIFIKKVYLIFKVKPK